MALLASRILGMVISFVSIGFLARHLNAAHFGLWTLMATFVSFAGNFDLGLGQGLRNQLALLSSTSTDSAAEQRRLFSAVFTALLLFALSLSALVIALVPQVPWEHILGINAPELFMPARWAITMVIILMLLNLPLNLYSAGFMAYQEVWQKSLIDLLQVALLLLFAVTAYASLPIAPFIGSYYGVYNMAAILGLAAFLILRRWRLTLLPWAQIKAMVSSIAGSSVSFWVLGVSAILLFSTDPIIVSRVAGLEEGGRFSVYQRLFIMLITLHFTVLNPLWSAYTHALGAGDWPWIARAVRRSVLLTAALCVAGSTVMILFGDLLVQLWTGVQGTERLHLALLSLWISIYAWINCYSVVLNGLGYVRGQALITAAAAALHIALSVFLGHRMGVPGVLIGAIVSILPIALYATFKVNAVVRRHLNPLSPATADAPEAT
ncbi:lipopolysaccharide biosynthesis protein [Deinococcus aquaedulcis]|uniref:lipopolysaccharide biosynthesis protein n=1 Tax=Deinococcus aquaedulcis TaxID=2840455 RepID=UPI001C82AF4B|nr:hypothetical protein [Deinococcus aquaedulcis]